MTTATPPRPTRHRADTTLEAAVRHAANEAVEEMTTMGSILADCVPGLSRHELFTVLRDLANLGRRTGRLTRRVLRMTGDKPC